jgi:hypothetical protein
MSRFKKTVTVSAVLILEFLSLSLFTNRIVSSAKAYVPPLLHTPSHTEARVARLDSPAKTDGGFVFESYGEPTPRSGVFLNAEENREISVRSFLVRPLFFSIILASKVPRYISKSVLNL